LSIDLLYAAELLLIAHPRLQASLAKCSRSSPFSKQRLKARESGEGCASRQLAAICAEMLRVRE
jgi:hypothetical protein